MTYTTIVAGVGDLTDNAHVIDRACEMARLNDAVLLLVAGFDPVAPRDRARLNDAPPSVRPAEARLTEDEAYGVVEKARDIAVERGVDLAQGVVVEGEAVSALTLVAIETQADLVVVGSRGVDSLLGRLFGAVSIQVLRKSRCDVLVVVEPDAATDSAAAAALRAAANSVAAAAVDTAVAHVVATDAAAAAESAAKTDGEPADADADAGEPTDADAGEPTDADAGKPADADAGKPGVAKLAAGKSGVAKLAAGKSGVAKIAGKLGVAKIAGKSTDADAGKSAD